MLASPFTPGPQALPRLSAESALAVASSPSQMGSAVINGQPPSPIPAELLICATYLKRQRITLPVVREARETL